MYNNLIGFTIDFTFKKLLFFSIALLFFNTLYSTSLEMDSIGTEKFTVFFSGNSCIISERVLKVTKDSYPIFMELFDADHDLKLKIYWAGSSDWDKIPQCRYKKSYGMPHMTKGKNHTHYIILPAANIDMPERVVRLIEPLFDMEMLSKSDTRKLKKLFSTLRWESNEGLKDYLSSSEFYVDFLVEIVLMHEIMHDFCFEFGIPENYGRDGQKAWWVFEGLAQWSVLYVNRRLGNDKWADLHELLYRWMYRTGKKYEGNISPIKYSNYAWYHGSLVEMFCQLEDKFGQNYGPDVLSKILKDIRGRDYLNNQEIVRIFSQVADQDLSQWFRSNWSIY